MKMTWRWFGEGNDSITLDQIKQIPGVEGIVWSLHDLPAGEEWPEERIEDVLGQIRKRGFNGDVVESVNIHDSIKIGLPERDKYIDAYIATIRKLGKAGVKVICYNFMPVFDWVRTDLYKGAPTVRMPSFMKRPWPKGIPRNSSKMYWAEPKTSHCRDGNRKDWHPSRRCSRPTGMWMKRS